MHPPIHREAERIFIEMLDVAPAARAARLKAGCEGQIELQQEVQGLLQAVAEAEAYFDAFRRRVGLTDGFVQPAQQVAQRGEVGQVGQSLGPYRLTQVLGSGGMGEVWCAERADGRYAGKVAIKLLAAPGSVTRHSFEREAQHLARLSHPNIARLLDADVSPQGRPFLVLELVEGEPIDVHCNRLLLTVEQRVLLFMQVLDAIAHAHAHLVVHRDIKPSNVWVTLQGEVKVLDFGISKLVSAAEPATEGGPMPTLAWALTPQFAAPEQIEAAAVTTATDVYALGLLLWMLVAGRTPRSGRELRSMAELRVVASEEPGSLWDSACRGLAPPALAAAARQRGSSVEALRKTLSGDVDSVLRKAVAVDARGRYATVGELAQDLQRWIDHRPVLAGPSTPGRRLRLYVRRHRAGAAASVAAGLLLAVIAGQAVNYTLTTARQSEAIARERDRAEQVQRFLIGVFASADPNQSKGADVTAREILDRATVRIGSEFSGQDATRADLSMIIGIIYGSLSELATAQRLLEESLRLRERSQPDSAAHAQASVELARLVTIRGDYERAESLARRALHIQDRLGDPEGIVHAATELGMVLQRRGGLDDAESHFLRALAVARARLGAHPLTPRALHALGSLLEQRDRLDESERLHQEGLELRRSLVGEFHLDMIESHYNLAMVQFKRGHFEQALQGHRQALAIIQRITPQGHGDAQYMLNGMAQAHQKLGQLEQAEARYLEALALIQRQFGDQHPNAAIVRFNLAQLLTARGRTAEAEPLLRGALATMAQAIPRSHRRLQAAVALARIESDRGRHDDAEALLLAAHQAAPTRASANALGDLYDVWGRADEARRYRGLAQSAAPARP